MADRKISDLTALTTPAAGDFLPIVDISEAAAASKNKRITIEELFRGVPLGTAAAPGIAFETDPNTGIYSPGADQLAVATNGVGRLFVNANGIVSVVSAVNWNFPGLFLRRTASNIATAKQISFLLDGDTESDTTLTNYLNIWGTYSGPPTTSSTSTGLSASFNIGAPNQFIVHTNGSQRAAIDSSGRLLIGTSTSYNAPSITGTQNASLNQTHSATAGIGSQLIAEWSTSTASGGSSLKLAKSNSGTVGTHTALALNQDIGSLVFAASDGSNFINAATILAEVDGTPGANDMPGRLLFSTTADGAASPTERLRITSAGVLQVADAGNITVGTTTGTKIGTATTQKLGFYNATPVVQPTAVADATDAATAITQLNDLLAKLRTLGIIAT
jgi:hypothetical protein